MGVFDSKPLKTIDDVEDRLSKSKMIIPSIRYSLIKMNSRIKMSEFYLKDIKKDVKEG
jgi:hypothetical protein